ncbi:MAG: hypothetical protein ACFFDV_03655 [Candidatus Thorarchaeota archaeon]
MFFYIYYFVPIVILSLASLLDCRVITTSVGAQKQMAETYIIRIGDIPSRKIRKSVRGFLEDEDVAVVINDGQKLGVILQKNQLIIKSTNLYDIQH